VIKVGLYKKGMTNNLVIHFELKSLSFKKKPNFSLIDDPLMKDFLNYINFNNFKEKIIYRRFFLNILIYFIYLIIYYSKTST